MKQQNAIHYYPTYTPQDELWGIVCTTCGRQFVSRYEHYPVEIHPTKYQSRLSTGRTLNEYQILYISKGSGWFWSTHCPKTRIKPGTAIILFPNEKHAYAPHKTTGWHEHWIGFKGPFIDKRVGNGFFTVEHPIVRVGDNPDIEAAYEKVIDVIGNDKLGCQIIASSMVLQILSMVVYAQKYGITTATRKHQQVEKAKLFMRQHIGQNISPKDVAKEIGVSYSYLRKIFEQLSELSPKQYQMLIQHNKAKELLNSTDLTISEIAYQLNYCSPQQLAQLFRKIERMTPSAYRKMYIK
ncbi:MAG: AraC family transcriptional regulator [Paludibacteraceae bacterium]|nr:AraC family transcriptional regulator [Paludibacteraceae bacterium]